MLNISESSKFYIYCPAGVVTGGAELLHQLVDKINSVNLNAYIVYFGEKLHEIPEEYKQYNIKVSEKIEDTPENIVVFFEGRFDLAFVHKNVQKIMWWLSVDHFFMFSLYFLDLRDIFKWNIYLGLKSILIRILKPISNNNTFEHKISINKLKKLNAINAYQSEYAQNFLISRGFDKLFALKDYINIDHLEVNKYCTRKNIILYNPKKGLNFTKRLIKKTPDFEWIPIQNMKRAQLKVLMQESKLYIDFGYHPGKDRLPREAVMNGCCIITGTAGSANFFEDVAIFNNYKFDQKKVSIDSILSQIRYVMYNYEESYNDFAYYRYLIYNEKDDFDRQVKTLLMLN